MNGFTDFKSGFISIIGRPNVGKSSLLNLLVGDRISAVSPKPNTTRNRILGIKTQENAQFVFIDTPGIRKARGKLEKAMVQAANAALHEADVLLVMIEVDKPFGPGDRFIIENLSKPSILLINKIDTVKKSKILEIINTSQRYSDKLLEVIPISVIEADGIDELIQTIIKYLPQGTRYFPDDMITDQSERFLVSEIIREKIFILLEKEIPYKTAVVIEEFNEAAGKRLLEIFATVYVERRSHKGIIIGSKGKMLKEIGTMARKDIEKAFGIKVFLEIWVKVKERWSDRENLVKDFGYGI
ncbi:MAG: GTPase Era [Thermodesulfobacteriota bacterium]